MLPFWTGWMVFGVFGMLLAGPLRTPFFNAKGNNGRPLMPKKEERTGEQNPVELT